MARFDFIFVLGCVALCAVPACGGEDGGSSDESNLIEGTRYPLKLKAHSSQDIEIDVTDAAPVLAKLTQTQAPKQSASLSIQVEGDSQGVSSQGTEPAVTYTPKDGARTLTVSVVNLGEGLLAARHTGV